MFFVTSCYSVNLSDGAGELWGQRRDQRDRSAKPIDPEFHSWLRDEQTCGLGASYFNSPWVASFPDEIASLIYLKIWSLLSRWGNLDKYTWKIGSVELPDFEVWGILSCCLNIYFQLLSPCAICQNFVFLVFSPDDWPSRFHFFFFFLLFSLSALPCSSPWSSFFFSCLDLEQDGVPHLPYPRA